MWRQHENTQLGKCKIFQPESGEDFVVCTCGESTLFPFMWGKALREEAVTVFSFIAHPGQIDDLCWGRSPQSVYNVAFALQWPDPATPKGNWFLPLCCPFASLSPLIVFLFPLIPASPFFQHARINKTNVCPALLTLHLPSSFISFAPHTPSLWLSCHACMFYCFIHFSPKPPSHSLPLDSSMVCSRFYLPLQLLCALFPLPLLLPLFPYRSMFCPITLSSPSSLSLAPLVPTSRLISYFPPLLSVCASAAKCYPFLLFSVCLCVLGPVLNPQLGWQMVYPSKESTSPSSRLYLTSPCYFIAVTPSQVAADTARLPPTSQSQTNAFWGDLSSLSLSQECFYTSHHHDPKWQLNLNVTLCAK